jgi:hypothetical protein
MNNMRPPGLKEEAALRAASFFVGREIASERAEAPHFFPVPVQNEPKKQSTIYFLIHMFFCVHLHLLSD